MSELIKTQEIAASISNAGEVLSKNTSLTQKAVEKAQVLIDTAASGMSDELDAEMNDWQIKAKQALAINNERRAPITQAISMITKAFTEQEGKLDAKKPESYYSQVQNIRNDWARQKAAKAKAKEQEVLRKQNFERENIALTSEAERQLRAKYSDVLFKFKTFANELYNRLDLTNQVETEAKIKNVKENYPLEDFNKTTLTLFGTYLTEREITAIDIAVKERLYDELAANFKENMEAEKLRLLDLIPSRMNELKAIHKASADERIRLEKEAENRRKQDEARIRSEQEAQAKANDEAIKKQQEMATAGTLFDTQSELAQIAENKGKTRDGYSIDVKSADGWGAIFLFWFEHEGKGLDAADIEKKTMKQIKSFCEKKALKDELKISHDDVIYKDVIKAVVSK